MTDKTREAFEAWMSDQGKWPDAIERSGEGYKLMIAHTNWTAWKAAVAATPSQGWMDIGTAPKDGTEILAIGLNWGAGPLWHSGFALWGGNDWADRDGTQKFDFLTHWLPGALPPPPLSAKEREL